MNRINFDPRAQAKTERLALRRSITEFHAAPATPVRDFFANLIRLIVGNHA
jgi:hypothetical protein